MESTCGSTCAPVRIRPPAAGDCGAVAMPTTAIVATVAATMTFVLRLGTARAYHRNMSRVGALVILFTVAPAFADSPDVHELVRRSVENNERNWSAAPQYSFTEKDVITSSGKTT